MVEWFAFGVASLALLISARREWIERRASRSSAVVVQWLYSHYATPNARHSFVIRNVGKAEARRVRVELQQAGGKVAEEWDRWVRRIDSLPSGQSVGMPVGAQRHGAPLAEYAEVRWEDDTGDRHERFAIGPEPARG